MEDAEMTMAGSAFQILVTATGKPQPVRQTNKAHDCNAEP